MCATAAVGDGATLQPGVEAYFSRRSNRHRSRVAASFGVHRSTKFDLVINLSSVKALGLSIPDKLLVAADEVIE